ncbi:hypothetical protein VTN00DRAFT_3237 [Thermoascus crustaceus]|uniref:uncharacterized protein n=1 Tax=Thermoascus crustaceus TaxID=5088 RepID=UPI0037445C2D
MSTTTITTTTTATTTRNELAKLSPRFEIRQLKHEHLPWINAIVAHGLVYASLWGVVYPENRTARCYQAFRARDNLTRREIESGMSFGVFDTEYQYKRPKSAKTSGKLYWDENNLEATREQLLEQMDFPLVSVALSYDGFYPPSTEEMRPMIDLRPLYATYVKALTVRDSRDPATWSPRGPSEVLMRSGTHTRADYAGHGLMKSLAHTLMREAARKGYRGIQIQCISDAVSKTWLNPPAPFEGSLVSEFDTRTFEDEVDGKRIKPFAACAQVCRKVYVTL